MHLTTILLRHGQLHHVGITFSDGRCTKLRQGGVRLSPVPESQVGDETSHTVVARKR
jgi:hypothetical protein